VSVQWPSFAMLCKMMKVAPKIDKGMKPNDWGQGQACGGTLSGSPCSWHEFRATMAPA
jgi:hypothetical protein